MEIFERIDTEVKHSRRLQVKNLLRHMCHESHVGRCKPKHDGMQAEGEKKGGTGTALWNQNAERNIEIAALLVKNEPYQHYKPGAY
jgi:hypothetical protein